MNPKQYQCNVAEAVSFTYRRIRTATRQARRCRRHPIVHCRSSTFVTLAVWRNSALQSVAAEDLERFEFHPPGSRSLLRCLRPASLCSCDSLWLPLPGLHRYNVSKRRQLVRRLRGNSRASILTALITIAKYQQREAAFESFARSKHYSPQNVNCDHGASLNNVLVLYS